MQSKGNTTAVIVLPNDTKVSFDPFSAYLSNGWEAGVAVGDTNSSAARESDWAVIYTPTDLFAGGGVPFVLEPDSKGQSLANRLTANRIAARVMKAARVSARFS